jgi:hypothetical protein
VVQLDPRGDVRQYIVNADIVVGFQTTALLEALGARRPTIYTWWTPPTSDYEDSLVPFHQEDEALTVVRSPEALMEAIEKELESPTAGVPNLDADRLVERFLGPIDGHAAARCWAVLEQLITEPEPSEARAELLRRTRLRRPAAAAAAAAGTAAWSVARATGSVGYAGYAMLKRALRSEPSLSREQFAREIGLRRREARDRLTATT